MVRVFPQPLFDDGGINRVAPVSGFERDIQAKLAGDTTPQRRELTVVERQHGIAR